MEGSHFIAKNKLTSFSEQDLVDCNKGFNEGCNGGAQEAAFRYLKKHSIETEQAYRYTGRDGKCKYDESKATGVKVGTWKKVKKNNGSELTKAIVKAPIAVSVDASGPAFMNYSRGIFTHKPRKCRLDHAVLAVGYGEENGQQYVIMKNSWNTDWGEDGYMKVAIDAKGSGAACIQNDPLYMTSN